VGTLHYHTNGAATTLSHWSCVCRRVWGSSHLHRAVTVHGELRGRLHVHVKLPVFTAVAESGHYDAFLF
jgi:hypothetical protein